MLPPQLITNLAIAAVFLAIVLYFILRRRKQKATDAAPNRLSRATAAGLLMTSLAAVGLIAAALIPIGPFTQWNNLTADGIVIQSQQVNDEKDCQVIAAFEVQVAPPLAKKRGYDLDKMMPEQQYREGGSELCEQFAVDDTVVVPYIKMYDGHIISQDFFKPTFLTYAWQYSTIWASVLGLLGIGFLFVSSRRSAAAAQSAAG